MGRPKEIVPKFGATLIKILKENGGSLERRDIHKLIPDISAGSLSTLLNTFKNENILTWKRSPEDSHRSIWSLVQKEATKK